MNVVNVYIGRRIRQRRQALQIEPGYLARELRVSPDRLCAYEKGSHRVSASKLWEVSRALDETVAYFFEDYSG